MSQREDVERAVLQFARKLDDSGERRHAACIAAYADEIAAAVVAALVPAGGA